MSTTNNLLLNVFIILLSILTAYALNHFLKGKYMQWIIGLLSAVAVGLCMSFPFTLFPGQIYDLRIIVILMGILYGGYGAGLFVTATAFFYRYLLGGFGFVQMVITFTPILALAFYLSPRFKTWSRYQKIMAATTLDGSIVALNILLVTVRYPVTRWHVTFLLEWALIEVLGIAFMVLITEIIRENVAMTQKMQDLEKSQLVIALAASIAHEIRNPLTVCRGFLQLLNESVTEEKHLFYTSTVLSELERAGTIIDDYLSFAKPQINGVRQVDAAEIVQGTIDTLAPFCASRNVFLNRDLMQCSLYIEVDPRKFEQAILNIMKNGIEAMTSGGTLTVKVRRKGQAVAIDIFDTGIGMTEEQIRRLGTPFYSTKTSGTGLGLMASYRFIHLMKGTIEVKSMEGWGTQFTVYVPLCKDSSEEECNHVSNSRMESLERSRASSE